MRSYIRDLAKNCLYYASVAAFALAAPALSSAQETLKFGVADPLTGPAAIFGNDQMQAVRWAVEDINAAGGVAGKDLEAIILDHQAKPEVGINAVNRLVNVDKVPVFITAFSNVVKAVAPIANRTETLMLSVGANSPEIKNLGDYVYTTFPLADVDMTKLGQYMYEEHGKRRAAVLFVNHETGTEGAKVFRESFENAGGEVVMYESYEQERSDFTGLVLQVKSLNPDIIHIHSVIRDFTAIVAQMRQLGVDVQVTSFQTAFNPEMIKELGAGAEGIIVTALAPSVEDNENLQGYLDRWQAEHGREPVGLPYTQYFYDAPYIIARLYEHVLEQGKEPTGENLRQALIDIGEFDLPLTNKVVFNEDHTVDKPVYFWQVQNGKFTLIGKSE
jgi:branched-chain amino acid transport system substrate-binding protein